MQCRVLFQILKLLAQQWNGRNFICSILTEHLQNPAKEIRLKLPLSGTYTTTTQSDGTSFELTYPNDSVIIGSCYGNRKEGLFLDTNNSLSSTWSYCDGPC
ncbi:hypothetical protein [Flavobacterium sp. GNP001]